jgi:hypothetical protein
LEWRRYRGVPSVRPGKATSKYLVNSKNTENDSTFIARRTTSMLGTILLVVLILILVGALPTWPHSRSWGYGPSGGLGLIVIILIILLLLGRI